MPEDISSDCESEEETNDSICKGRGISVTTDPQSIKFEILSTRIHEYQRKQCVVCTTYISVVLWNLLQSQSCLLREWGRVMLGILGGSVLPGSPNCYPIIFRPK